VAVPRFSDGRASDAEDRREFAFRGESIADAQPTFGYRLFDLEHDFIERATSRYRPEDAFDTRQGKSGVRVSRMQ
jgi:hypothetical protein